MTVWVGQLQKDDPDSDDRHALMVADTLEELHGAALAGGVPVDQFSGHEGDAKARPHYRLAPEQRDAVMGQREVHVVGVGHVYV